MNSICASPLSWSYLYKIWYVMNRQLVKFNPGEFVPGTITPHLEKYKFHKICVSINNHIFSIFLTNTPLDRYSAIFFFSFLLVEQVFLGIQMITGVTHSPSATFTASKFLILSTIVLYSGMFMFRALNYFLNNWVRT